MALRAVVLWGVALLLPGAACGASSADQKRELPSAGACDECGGELPTAGASSNGGAGGEGSASPAAEGGAVPNQAGGPTDSAAGHAGEPTAPPPPDLSLRAVTISQTVEIPLMQGGSEVLVPARGVPLISGKRSLVRAFVDVVEPFRQRPLLGVLDIDTGERTRSLVSERTIVAGSTQDDLSSSFVFEVAAADLTPRSSYRVRVLEADTTPLALFPDAGYVPLAARTVPAFQLVIVPYVIKGFAPKTGEAELAALRKRLVALYPSIGVDITIAPPLTPSYVVDADAGWDEALDEIYELRAADKPAHDVFYFGLMAPAPSYDAFCPDGCTVGYSVVADADDVDARGSIGIGVFPDGSGSGDAWDTVAHELGHALGRSHTPCPPAPSADRPDGIDPRWPDDVLHRSAALGAYGYDFEAAKLIGPRQAKDVMSYCTPVWTSDYTYTALYKRLAQIQDESFRVLDSAPRERFRLARITRDGGVRWLGDRFRHGRARTSAVDLLDSAGRRLGEVQAQVARIDHAAGGYVWLPARELSASGAASVDLRPLGGGVLHL